MERARARGIRRIVDDVVHCQLDDRGWVDHM